MVEKWFMAMSHTSQYMYPDGMFFMDDPVTWDIVVDFLFFLMAGLIITGGIQHLPSSLVNINTEHQK